MVRIIKKTFVLKINTSLLFLLMALSCLINTIHAEVPLSPVVYPMKFVYIFEGDKPEVIIVIGNSGFRSIASFKNFCKQHNITLVIRPGG